MRAQPRTCSPSHGCDRAVVSAFDGTPVSPAARVDHAAAASGVGKELRPTTLLRCAAQGRPESRGPARRFVLPESPYQCLNSARDLGPTLCDLRRPSFGNPLLGTPLMTERQTVGIDLPCPPRGVSRDLSDSHSTSVCSTGRLSTGGHSKALLGGVGAGQ
jgi:hypothetical protein